MDKVKIVQDQLDTVIAEAGRTESYLKSQLVKRDRVINLKAAEVRTLNARLALLGDDSIPLTWLGRILQKLFNKFGMRDEES